MMSARPDGALAVGIGCYILGGIMPIHLLLMGHAGAGPWEIMSERMLWALPCAALLVIAARQGEEMRRRAVAALGLADAA